LLGVYNAVYDPSVNDAAAHQIALVDGNPVRHALPNTVGSRLLRPCCPGGDAFGRRLPDWSISKSNLIPPPDFRIASIASFRRIVLCILRATKHMAMTATLTRIKSVIRLHRSQRRRGLRMSVMQAV
jgi:hypothetical protein